MAVVGEDGLVGYGYVSEDDGLYDWVTLQPAGQYGWERRNEIEPESEGYSIVYNTVEQFLKNNFCFKIADILIGFSLLGY